jgi:hypothetical protein
VILKKPNVANEIARQEQRQLDKAGGALRLLRHAESLLRELLLRAQSGQLTYQEIVVGLERVVNTQKSVLDIRERRGESVEDSVTAADHDEAQRRQHSIIANVLRYAISHPDRAAQLADRLAARTSNR